MPSILSIGAGIAGLAAARKLMQKGHTVTVLDKGRGVGGRMATRRMEQSRADHGAQYFTAHSPEFSAFVEELLLNSVAGIWPVTGTDNDRLPYIGRDGMSAIPKYLAQKLNVVTGERVVRLEKIDRTGTPGWRAIAETGHTFEADQVLLSMPAPQVLTLLQDSGLDATDIDLNALQAITYTPCIAVIAVLSAPTAIPKPGAFRPEQGPVAWVADNYQKGISPNQPSVTIQAGGAFSLAHFDDDLTTVGQTLLQSVASVVSPDQVVSFQVHRWRYSLTETRHPEPFLRAHTSAPLLVGGDGFGPGNVEGAYLSGLAMAEALG